MTTALDMITSALQDLGAIAVEEAPTAAEAVGALNKLNNLIDSWNIENLMIYGVKENVFNLTAGQGVYTLGTGGDFNIPRPNIIQSAYLRTTTNPTYDTPVTVLTQAEYAALPQKNITDNLPLYLYYDNNYPLMNVYLNPVPNTTSYKLVLWTDRLINNLSLYEQIMLPPGYQRALESNLVIELSPSYGRPVSEATALIARESKATVMRNNLVINELEIDPRLTRRYFNIYEGW
jgi:hypothetical protein